MSLMMQTVNVIPWEIMAEQQALYDKLVFMEVALRESDSPETDPRRSNTVPADFFFFHEEPDQKYYPGETRI